MWQFEYVVQLEGKIEILKYDGKAIAPDDVWGIADAQGNVLSITKRILVDGKVFREFDFPRNPVLPTHDESLAYLDRT